MPFREDKGTLKSTRLVHLKALLTFLEEMRLVHFSSMQQAIRFHRERSRGRFATHAEVRYPYGYLLSPAIFCGVSTNVWNKKGVQLATVFKVLHCVYFDTWLFPFVCNQCDELIFKSGAMLFWPVTMTTNPIWTIICDKFFRNLGTKTNQLHIVSYWLALLDLPWINFLRS